MTWITNQHLTALNNAVAAMSGTELADSVHHAKPGTIIQHTTNGGNWWRTLFILTTPNQWLVVPLDVPSLETDGYSVSGDHLHDIITNTPGIWEFCAEARWYR